MTTDTVTPIRRGPMEFGEMLGGSFRLTGQTIGTAGILTIIVIVGSSLLVGLATQSYFDAIIASFTAASGLNPEKDGEAFQKAMMPMMGAMALNFGIQFVYLLVIVFTQVITTLAGWYAVHGQKIGLGDLLGLAFKRSYWMSAIQTLMIVIFLFVLYLAAAILGAVLGIPYLFLIPYALFVVWFMVKVLTRLQLICIEDRGPWQGMMASSTLSKGNWFRSFLVVLAPTLVMGAVSVLSSMALMGGRGLFDLQGASVSAEGNDVDYGQLVIQMKAMRESFTSTFFAVTGAITAIYILILTHLSTLLYIDLKGRRGDFDLVDESPGEGEAVA